MKGMKFGCHGNPLFLAINCQTGFICMSNMKKCLIKFSSGGSNCEDFCQNQKMARI